MFNCIWAMLAKVAALLAEQFIVSPLYLIVMIQIIFFRIDNSVNKTIIHHEESYSAILLIS